MTLRVTSVTVENKGEDLFNPRPPSGKKLGVCNGEKVASEAEAH